MLFKYTGIDSSGSTVKSKIEAVSINDAKEKLKSKKIIYKSIEEEKSLLPTNISFQLSSKITPLVLANISRDLSIYLNAGISLVNAIKLISERYKKDKKLNSFFESLSSFLDEGKDFYTALDMQKSIQLPEFYKQSIKISENGGLLQSVLLELADFLKEQDRIKKQMSSAMAYPMFILFVSFGMVGFMLSYIVPKITAIFDQMHQELPGITVFVMDLGDFFSHHYMKVLIAVVILILGFITMLKKSYAFKYFIDRFLLRLPFVGSLIEMSELSRFSYMNSILIRSGVPIVQSFKMGANILKNSVLRRLFEEASIKVVEGERLSKILDNNDIYPIDSAFIHSIAIGEETSQLSKILSNLADLYNESNKDKINIFLSLLEPIFMLVVGSIIGFIVVAMLLPIFSMNLG